LQELSPGDCVAEPAACHGAPAAFIGPERSIGDCPWSSPSCQAFVRNSTASSNWSEFCDHRLDTQIDRALASESTNAPDTAALWAQADRTATDQAPAIPLTTTTDIHLVSARVHNYQYSLAQGVLLDQLWVR